MILSREIKCSGVPGWGNDQQQRSDGSTASNRVRGQDSSVVCTTLAYAPTLYALYVVGGSRQVMADLFYRTWLWLNTQTYLGETTAASGSPFVAVAATAATMVNITHVNLLQLATSLDYANSLHAITNASIDHVSLLSYDPSFLDILGSNVTQRLVAEFPWQAFHEAGAYNLGMAN